MSKSVYHRALNADKAGNWEAAHELVQDLPTKEAAWIHAYLHKKEGDDFNAQYWYNRADRPFFEGSLEEEWEELSRYFNS